MFLIYHERFTTFNDGGASYPEEDEDRCIMSNRNSAIFLPPVAEGSTLAM